MFKQVKILDEFIFSETVDIVVFDDVLVLIHVILIAFRNIYNKILVISESMLLDWICT